MKNNLDYVSLNIKTAEFEKIIATDSIGNEIPSYLSTQNNKGILKIPIGDLGINKGNKTEIIHVYRKPIHRKTILLIVKGRRIKQLSSQYDNKIISSKLIDKSSLLGLFKKRTYEIAYYGNLEENFVSLDDSRNKNIRIDFRSFLDKLISKREGVFLLKRNIAKTLLKEQ